jgi:hypothetical protein
MIGESFIAGRDVSVRIPGRESLLSATAYPKKRSIPAIATPDFLIVSSPFPSWQQY